MANVYLVRNASMDKRKLNLVEEKVIAFANTVLKIILLFQQELQLGHQMINPLQLNQ
jgi:hypothetical protein